MEMTSCLFKRMTQGQADGKSVLFSPTGHSTELNERGYFPALGAACATTQVSNASEDWAIGLLRSLEVC